MESNFGVTEAQAVPSALDDIETLMQVHRTRILRFVMLSIRDADAAASITQDCFLKAYRYRAQFRGECAISTWLIRIAYRLICDHTRTERFRFWKRVQANAVDAQEMANSLPQGGSSPERHAIAQQQVQAVFASLEHLSDRQRAVFTLHFIDEMTADEIATSLTIPVSTVKTHLYRSIAKMRKVLGAQV
ncbi:RNA polymerase sigma factor [Acidipila sp. EB88]|uniref:RNA polymerase sigma factor n=1 Tax=Acidipila sp. EB88 TaxID=2305226 RepID=UPI001F29987B|nr:RNA polymerase sigma factor [Acidipila sp. EB88]